MLKRVWELHRTMILVGLFGLGFGLWLSADAEQFQGVVLGQDSTSLTIYQSSGAVVVVPIVDGVARGDIVLKSEGEACCQVVRTEGDLVSGKTVTQLRGRYDMYWSQWSGTVEGFVMREHVDDADTALIRDLEGGVIQWKVWESHLAGLKRGEKLCKVAQTWSPQRCNPEAGVVEFKPAAPSKEKP